MQERKRGGSALWVLSPDHFWPLFSELGLFWVGSKYTRKKASSKMNVLLIIWSLHENWEGMNYLPFLFGLLFRNPCHLSNSILEKGSQSYLWPRKQLEQIYVLREACLWEIIWRIWTQSIPQDKQSQTKIDITHRDILLGPQCIFKNLSHHWKTMRFQI